MAVRCNGRLTGTPFGTLEGITAPTHDLVATRIEWQIENLDQVRE